MSRIIPMTQSQRYAIDVAVKPAYLADQSDPAKNQYVFAYTITITNAGTVTAQLISRHWFITDSVKLGMVASNVWPSSATIW